MGDYVDGEIDPWKPAVRKHGQLPDELQSTQVPGDMQKINAVGEELYRSLHDVAAEVLQRHNYPADEAAIKEMTYGFADTNTGFALGQALMNEGPSDQNLNMSHQAFDSYVKSFVTTPPDLLE